MPAESIETLSARFAVPGHLSFEEGPGGLQVARIANAHAEARVSLSGGHVMTWAPRGESPVLWLSRHASFAPGKSIRGGIPICWPWFGPHEREPGFPGHGFARTVPWTVEGAEALADGSTRLTLALEPGEATRAQWPYRSRVTNVVTVGREIAISLVTRNLGGEPFVLGEALHTYFAVSDVRKAPIRGLEGTRYVDKVAGGEVRTQEGPIVIGSEVDRVYLGTTSECTIDDTGLGRRIRITKEGSRSTVVWNPWEAKAAKMGDFGPEGYLGMVCVESGNALEDVVTVPAGTEHTLSVRYRVEPLAA